MVSVSCNNPKYLCSHQIFSSVFFLPFLKFLWWLFFVCVLLVCLSWVFMIICWVWVSVGFFFRSGRAICFHLKKFHAHLISNTPTSDQAVFKEFFLCPIICQTTVHIHGVSGAERGWWCRLGGLWGCPREHRSCLVGGHQNSPFSAAKHQWKRILSINRQSSGKYQRGEVLFKHKDKNKMRVSWEGVKSSWTWKFPTIRAEQRQEEAANKTKLKHKTQLV